MAKTCDICGGKVGFRSFRCMDGVVCKNCYRIVSGNYASTIAGLSLKELKRRYIQNAQPLNMGEDGFAITRKIGVFLLLDEKNRKLCIPNNRKITKGSTRPEIYPFAALEGVELVSDPARPLEELTALAADKNQELVIRLLAIRLHLQGAGTREIVLIPTPVRTSSFAFRQSVKLAQEILECLQRILTVS